MQKFGLIIHTNEKPLTDSYALPLAMSTVGFIAEPDSWDPFIAALTENNLIAAFDAGTQIIIVDTPICQQCRWAPCGGGIEFINGSGYLFRFIYRNCVVWLEAEFPVGCEKEISELLAPFTENGMRDAYLLQSVANLYAAAKLSSTLFPDPFNQMFGLCTWKRSYETFYFE